MLYNSLGSFRQVSFKHGLSAAVVFAAVSETKQFKEITPYSVTQNSVDHYTFINCEWVNITSNDQPVFSYSDPRISVKSPFDSSITSSYFHNCCCTGSLVKIEAANFELTSNCFYNNQAQQILAFTVPSSLYDSDRTKSGAILAPPNDIAMQLCSISHSTAVFSIYAEHCYTFLKFINISQISQTDAQAADCSLVMFAPNPNGNKISSSNANAFNFEYCTLENSTGPCLTLKQDKSEVLTDFAIQINQFLWNKSGEKGVVHSVDMANVIVKSSFFINNTYDVAPCTFTAEAKDPTNQKYIVVFGCVFSNAKPAADMETYVQYVGNNPWEQNQIRTFTFTFLNTQECIGWTPLPNADFAEFFGFRKQEIAGLVVIAIGMIALLSEMGYKMYKCCCWVPTDDDDDDPIDEGLSKNEDNIP